MKTNTLTRSLGLIAPLMLALAVAAAPRDAHAQFRASGYLGYQRITGGGNASGTFVARAEATVGFIPWLQAGLYGESLSPFSEGKTGWGLGAVATLRPMLPGTSIDPMGYASIGYQRAPVGSVFAGGPLFEVGAGLSWHVIPVLDIELRGGYVGLFDDNGLHGFSASAGVSLHP